MAQQRLISIAEAARRFQVNPWQVSRVVRLRGLQPVTNPACKRGKWFPQQRLLPMLRAQFKRAS